MGDATLKSKMEHQDYDAIRRGFEEWEKTTLRRTLDAFPERSPQFSTLSWIPIKRLYTPLDTQDLNYEKELGAPGQFPYTRGVYPTMYRGKPWTMRQFSGFGAAKETNKRYKYLLKSGQTGLSVAFHLPTLMGYDSDDPRSLGEVGKCGVAIDSLKDMEQLFEGIPLDKVSTSMTINSGASVMWAMYLAVAEKQGVDWKKLDGTIQNDVLKEYIAQKTYIFPPRPGIRLILDMFEFCVKEVPKWHPISISGYHIREAGSTAVQELAFTLADGLAYVHAAQDRGLDVNAILPKLSFFFNSHNDFFEEIAKYRAARRLWAKEVKQRFHPSDPRAYLCRFHAQTAGVSLTAQQPYNNVVRVALQALAAALGGAQSIHTNSLDEALALPTEHAVTIALRTQQILQNETGITDTIDPLGGSYFLESLTNEMEKRAKEYIDRIDHMGGMVAAVEQGYPQREIVESSARYQHEIEQKKRIIVGMNEYTDKNEKQIPTLKIGMKTEREQIASVRKLRKIRNPKKWKEAMTHLHETAKTDKNMMPSILAAVRAYATFGEICNVMREEFGQYKEPHIM